eukprot:12354403-Ditylum_brightwellii.AAC.1
MGRWSGDIFMTYIHCQIGSLTKGVARGMAQKVLNVDRPTRRCTREALGTPSRSLGLAGHGSLGSRLPKVEWEVVDWSKLGAHRLH